MKRFILSTRSCLLLLMLLLASRSNAQEFVPFGEFSQAALEMTQCSFDPDADAVILLHEAKSYYNDYYQLITEHHLRIKILREKGIAQANVTIPFYRRNDFENLLVTKAATFNYGDGKPTVPVERKSIYSRDVNERWGEVSFAFPSVKVGSILEYEYQSIMKSYGGLSEWDFQDRLPVVKSAYNLVVVPNTEFAYQVRISQDYNAVAKPNSSDGSIYFEMSNIPGLDDEPYIDSRKDYLQKVVFQLSAYGRGDGTSGSKYMTSWEEVIREMNTEKNFGGQVGKTIAGTERFINEAKAITDEQQRMQKIYSYVVHTMGWDGLYSPYVVNGVKSAWQKKIGNSAEINFVLINLLREAGLDVCPTLVSPRWNGYVDKTYPFVDQFRYVVACVKINGRQFYLDAVEKYTPAVFTPYDLLNTTGLLVTKKDGGLVQIRNDSLRYSESIVNQVKVISNDSIVGSARIISSQYAKVSKLEQYMEKRNAFIKDNYKNEKFPLDIADFSTEGANDSSLAFIQSCSFRGKLGSAGEFLYLPLDLFAGFSQNPFLSNKRFSNVNFGYSKSVMISTDVELPAGYEPVELPKNTRLVSEAKDITLVRTVEYDKALNTVSAIIQFDLSKSLYSPREYPLLQAFYKKMFQYLGEPLLLKKK